MRETRIRRLMQTKIEACRNELDWLLKCYLCAVNDYPEEYCPPRPLQVFSGYHTKLVTRAKMAVRGILPPPLKMILKKHFPLPVRQSPVLPHPEIPSCSSSLPCTEPESSGVDQTESHSFGVPVDGPKEEQSGISLAREPNDMTGKHRDGERIPLDGVSTFFRRRGQGGAQARAFLVLKSPSVCTELEEHEELHPKMEQTVDECKVMPKRECPALKSPPLVQGWTNPESSIL